MTRNLPRNLLDQEASPYLLQHKDNPVHWHPWSADTLALAKSEKKPILLSVGYAACHWCHVMAHESFEDDAIAGLMNELYINIKVDREERPDIDAIYQSALQMMGEQGGWPLTMFLTPDLEPFWGGTYFPATPRYGRPAFPDILKSIAHTFDNNNDKILENAAAMKQGLARMAVPEGGGDLSLQKLDAAASALSQMLDTIKGGTQGAPKFPQPSLFGFLWETYRRTGEATYRDGVTLTLDHICQGGIYDHLGGGFARYSTDEVWLAPHFEKMLYDNALLVDLLTDVWQQTRNPLYAVRIRETIDWALREMRSSEEENAPFGFTAAFDADSEGEEGKFAVWSEAEIDEILASDSDAFKKAYDVTASGNWEHKVILNRSHDLLLGDEASEAALRSSREKLLAVRNKRIWPQRDDKVLADWNGLMIAALAKAGAVMDEAIWIETAEDVFNFIVDTMTGADGRLRHSWCAGRLQHPATLDDYANMADAAIMLYGVTGKDAYLGQAEGWVDIVDRHYWDSGNHGYFLSAEDTDDVIQRTKTVMDNAVPSGNGVMAKVLAKLFYLTGGEAYRRRAEQLFHAIAGKEPMLLAHQSSLLGGFALLEGAAQIVIIADSNDPAAAKMARTVFDDGLQGRLVSRVSPDAGLAENHPAHGKKQIGGKATAYICRGPVCGLPITEVPALREELSRI
ncbi:MAG: thioredoxin domain-containing protein [Proteobacteria bacterium]|nr:thioredoxin domain-containing protein [Pseudomonadota bacterium]MDA1021745.1 thioredoxin domain-containing protein [Pseudomonadota bacterium]